MAQWRRWTFPLYRPCRDRTKENARQLLLYLETLLTKTGLNASEVEETIEGLRECAIGGLRYNISCLEAKLGIEQEVKVGRVKRAGREKPKKETRLSKRIPKKPRGGFFI